ncbi:hypothetical protein SLEP1_g27685 [Rubroshorea leprosula]|uniref:Uncharacterized protein n=1 Tax=Rubroshorea leprosula TaxID=152421 RepID=A0AAV5K2K3_9ROSI|nr:hypothetical protein SLEP1_g27685 [Rubroshorea leprosula]
MYNGIGFVDLTKKPNRDILEHDRKCWKLLSLPMRSLCYDGDGAISKGG